MSRSNPQANSTPNPASRWFEWSGEAGVIRYYDKDAKANVDVGPEFQFVLLDQLGCVRGWHEASKSGIYSNEVRDTRQDAMIVRAFKGGTLVEGIYSEIKHKVNSMGGKFNANLYVGFKNGGNALSIGGLRFKGAALGAWMEFTKTNRDELYSKAVKITGFVEGKKGRITYRVPALKIVALSPATNDEAKELDVTLQGYLSKYLKKNKRDQVETAPPAYEDEPVSYYDDEPVHITVDDIPF